MNLLVVSLLSLFIEGGPDLWSLALSYPKSTLSTITFFPFVISCSSNDGPLEPSLFHAGESRGFADPGALVPGELPYCPMFGELRAFGEGVKGAGGSRGEIETEFRLPTGTR